MVQHLWPRIGAGNLWFGTGLSGVLRYDSTNWTTFTTRDGLGHNSVVTIAEDKNGNLWFGGPGGVSRYTPPRSR